MAENGKPESPLSGVGVAMSPIASMNILLAHNDYARFSGEEAAIENVARALMDHDHAVSWFRRSSTGIGDSVLRKGQALFSGIYSFDARHALARLLDQHTFDVAQVQNLYPFLSASILPELKSRDIPVVMRCPNYRLFCPTGLHLRDGHVCEECLGGLREWHCVRHNCESDWFKSIGYAARNAFGRLTGMITGNVDVFVALTEFQRSRFGAAGIPVDRIEILPNPASVQPEGELRAGGSYVGFVGRVSEEKGIAEFLQAARRLTGIEFRVAGNLDAQLRLDKIPLNVHFDGFLSGQALDDFYAQSRIMVFPSKWFEGFPNTIAMAMGHAKPVIGTAIGAIPEIVEDGETGLLARPGDGDDLADKIAHLWRRPDLCAEMGRAGWLKAQREYSHERFYERLMQIYARAQTLQGRQKAAVVGGQGA